MSLISEASLRAQFKNETPTSIDIHSGDIVTPSARQYLKERGITVNVSSKSGQNSPVHQEIKERPLKENFYRELQTVKTEFQPKYVSNYDGGYFEEKPEHMTHLKGNKLVFKDDLHIIFRGRLDSLQSLIMEIQLQFLTSPVRELQDNLDEILATIRSILRAEVLDEPVEINKLFGLAEAEIREHSHHPQKHYGVEHFVPDVSMGLEVVMLNKLRTEIREVELVAMKTFKQDNVVTRKDIIKVFNRLSSAAYVLMCRIRGNYYSKSRV